MPSGSNSGDMFRANRTRLLHNLLRAEESSRVLLSKDMGITQAAVSKLASRLIEDGLMCETGYYEGALKRRSIGLCLSGGIMVLAVHITRSYVELNVITATRSILDTVREAIDLAQPDSMIILRAAIDARIAEYPGIAAICVAAPMPLIACERQILLYPEYGSANPIDLRHELLPRRFGGRRVLITKYAAAAAMNDWWLAGRGDITEGILAHIELDAEVSAGIVLNGLPLSGAQCAAGEIGHITLNSAAERMTAAELDSSGLRCACGNAGCLNAYCSEGAFMRYVEEQRKFAPDSRLSSARVIGISDVFDAANTGDSLARSCIMYLGRCAGQGIVALINMLNPNAIVIGGSLAQAGGLLLDEMRRTVQAHVHPEIYSRVTIELANEQYIGATGILMGAGAYALVHALTDPDVLIERARVARAKLAHVAQ